MSLNLAVKNSEKTVGLARSKNATVYHIIESYLEDKGSLSKNTRKAYESVVKHFFYSMLKKGLVELVPEDLEFYSSDIMRYRNSLMKSLGNNTINQRMDILSGFFKFLKKEKINDNIDPELFALKRLPTLDNGYGMFTWEEVEIMIEEVKNQRSGLEKSLLIELAVKSRVRKNALLNLTWNNIKKYDAIHYKITTIDKTKENVQYIKKEMYEKLLQLKVEGKNKIFNMTDKTANNMINALVEKLNLDPNNERNLTFHSLKKCGEEEVFYLTGKNPVAAAKAGNHSPTTAVKTYLGRNDADIKMIGAEVGEKLDFSKLRELSKDELVDLIENKLNNRLVQIQIMDVVKKMR